MRIMISVFSFMFTEANPDKGTETISRSFTVISLIICLQKLTPIRGRKLYFVPSKILMCVSFTEANPDKGTETLLSYRTINLFVTKFTEANPDKGTETGINLIASFLSI